MLATLVDQPFSRKGWVFEEKYDGVRMLAYKEGERVSLISRNGIDRTTRYPGITSAVAELGAETLLLDGEVVVFDSQRVSRFQLLQQNKGTPRFAVFDCLYRDGVDLREKPFNYRRKAVDELVKPRAEMRPAARLAGDGLAAFEVAVERGLEGVVAKDDSSPYVQGRSRLWLKVKVHARQEFVIGGFTAPEGARKHFGALLVGVFRGDELHYAGKVGTGFTAETLRSLHQQMKRLRRVKSPFVEDTKERMATFVSPGLVAEIAFTERTKDGKLRHPVFVGLREDKSAKEVLQ